MVTVRRTSARALVLTPEKELLLIRIENPDSKWTGWITPGGGIDPGETPEDALRRELREELALHDFKVIGRIWTRSHSFPWSNQMIEQNEFFFLVHTEKFAPLPTMDPGVSEMVASSEFRWWTIDEIKKSKEQFSPDHLGDHLQRLIQFGPPPTPLDITRP